MGSAALVRPADQKLQQATQRAAILRLLRDRQRHPAGWRRLSKCAVPAMLTGSHRGQPLASSLGSTQATFRGRTCCEETGGEPRTSSISMFRSSSSDIVSSLWHERPHAERRQGGGKIHTRGARHLQKVVDFHFHGFGSEGTWAARSSPSCGAQSSGTAFAAMEIDDEKQRLLEAGRKKLERCPQNSDCPRSRPTSPHQRGH